jgi:hypothetical protein
MQTEIEKRRFQDVLATKAQQWRDAKSFSRWDPPDGTYVFRVLDIVRGEHEDNYQWWRIEGIIETADNRELAGHEWSPFFFTDQWLGFLKDFLKETIGVIPDDLVEADNLLDSMRGWLLLVESRTVSNPKTGKTNVNKSVLRVVEKAA